jgi:hypothetical protein
VPGGQIDIHTAQTYALVLNGTTTNNAYTAFSSNSVGKWRIGNTYNAGANTFDVYNLGTSSNAISINSTTNNVTLNGSISATQFILSGATSPSGLYYNSGINRVTIANYTAGGSVLIETNGGIAALSLASNQAATFSSSVTAGRFASNVASDFDALLITNTTNSKQYSFYPSGNSLRIYDYSNGDVMSLLNGNVLINSTIDDTVNKLQVNGSGIFSGKLKVETTSANSPQFLVRDTTNTGYGVTSYFQNSAKTLYIGFGDQNYASFSDKIIITSAGVTTISNLAGTGSRAVLADVNGVLSAPVSDISVKQNIQTIGYGLNEIIKMNPVWFDYIDEYKSMGDKRQNGNIAQEMEAIIPEAVFTTPSTGKMGINYDQLHAVYIKAIQELNAKIDALKNN